jgi:hypothetical protein
MIIKHFIGFSRGVLGLSSFLIFQLDLISNEVEAQLKEAD